MELKFVTGLLFLATLSNGQEYTPGIRRNKGLTRLINLFAIDRKFDLEMNDKCAGKMGPVCFNNYILLTCLAGQVFNKYDCKAVNAAKPYCEKSACTNKKPETLSTRVKFRCTSVGLFPNPDDCTSYYQCKDIYPREAEIFDCQKNYVFDSKTGMCKRKRNAADCRAINCMKKSNTYQLFASDKSILVFCSDILGDQETILFRCPHYYEMEYDPNTFECKYSCTKEGYFTDPDADDKYYVCYKDGPRFESDHMNCPNGYWFDPNRKACSMRTSSGAGGSDVGGNVPVGSAPGGSDAGGSALGGSVPGSSAPGGSALGGSDAGTSVPGGNTPGGNDGAGSITGGSTPGENADGASTPGGTDTSGSAPGDSNSAVANVPGGSDASGAAPGDSNLAGGTAPGGSDNPTGGSASSGSNNDINVPGDSAFGASAPGGSDTIGNAPGDNNPGGNAAGGSASDAGENPSAGSTIS